MTNKGLFLIVAIVVLAAGNLFAFHNCARARLTHANFPPIGQQIQLKPVERASANKPHGEYKNVLIYITAGSRTLDYDEDSIVRMYSNPNDSAPIYEFTAGQLRDMYSATGCTSDLTAALENAFIGDVLFCNGKLDLSKIGFFTYQRKTDAKPKTSTSYVVEYVKEDMDLVAITLNF